MTLLGALLALPPRPLYMHGGRGGAVTALEDQHLGGAIMLLAGGLAYLAGGLALALVVLKRARAPVLGAPS
jgi:putative membrane protein